MRIAWAQRALRGETVCGDACTSVETDCGTVVAIADGLGHGPAAAEAAQLFCRVVGEHATEPLALLMQRASAALAPTRGAAAAILAIDTAAAKVGFVGIGNIETHARSRHAMKALCVPGIVGRPLRRVSVLEFGADAGDVLVLHTDGISSRFDLDELRGLPPDELARRILDTHGKDHDDATCVAIEI